MPGYVLHDGAMVQCTHLADATPMAPSQHVFVDGNAAVTQIGPYRVTNCPNNPGVPSPCVIATWTSAATRVRSFGQPLVLTDSTSTSVPNGTPLEVTKSQTRVKAV
jgi:hypothetical protein